MRALKNSPKPNEKAAAQAYLAALPPAVSAGLRKLQRAIAAAAPEAELGFSYGIPAFRLRGRPLVWFAAFKAHSSFFPGATALRLHRVALRGYKTSKGTLQFPPGQPPPATLVAKLVRTRLAELQKPRR